MRWLSWLFKKHTEETSPTPRSPGAFELYGDLTELPEGAVIGAGFAPGYSSDLTCWRVWIYPDGRVRQEIWSISVNDYRGEERIEEGRIEPTVVAALVSAAEVAGLPDMEERYICHCTDLEQLSLVVRFSDGVRSVCVYGPWFLVGEGHREVGAVLGVWLSVQRFTPWHSTWWHGH